MHGIMAREERTPQAPHTLQYIFPEVLDEAPGKFAAQLGKRALFVGRLESPWFRPIQERILKSLTAAGVEVLGHVRSAGPNAPFVDVYRIHSHIMHKRPDMIVVADAGSGIDAVKAATVLATLGDIQPEIDPFFGVGQVTSDQRVGPGSQAFNDPDLRFVERIGRITPEVDFLLVSEPITIRVRLVRI